MGYGNKGVARQHKEVKRLMAILRQLKNISDGIVFPDERRPGYWRAPAPLSQFAGKAHSNDFVEVETSSER